MKFGSFNLGVNKHELALWGAAFLLLMLIIVYGIITINFIARELNQTLTADLPNGPAVVTFNLGTLKELVDFKGRALTASSSPATTTIKQ